MSGATNCPETPRQKMVGLMYIVFLALVALNVAGEVLTAFVIVNGSMNDAVENANIRTEGLYNELSKQHKVNPAKVEEAFGKSKNLKQSTKEIFDYIQDLKVQLVKHADGPEGDINNIVKADNLDAGPEIMLGPTTQKGKELKNKIKEYREILKKICDADSESAEGLRNDIDRQLGTKDKTITQHGETVTKTWEHIMFDHMPLIACITMLTNTQTSIKSVEALVVKYLVSSITADDMNFSDIEAVVTTESNYILRGSRFQAKIFLAAYDKNNPAKVYVNGSNTPLPYDENGKGDFSIAATSLGKKDIQGEVKLLRLDGSEIVRPFKYSYTVGERGLVVSPTKMNVMYLGVNNPLEISVPGVPNNKISVEMTNAVNKKVGPGSYIVNPKKAGKMVSVKVYAQLGGKKEYMGNKDFRVKIVPSPVAKVARKTGGSVTKSELLAQVGIVADLENFVFDLKFNIKRFTISASIGGFSTEIKSNSYKFTKEQLNFMKRLKRKSKLYIEEIVVVGPDGTERQLPAISLKVI